jgi:succinylarginine dihydrolase
MLVVEQHQLDPSRCVFAQQNPEAIDAGVFHNDVISVSNENVFIYHEDAFANTEQVIGELQDKWSQLSNDELYLIKASNAELSLDDAVKSYLYNSQIITLDNGEMLLLAPLEARENTNAYKHIQKIISGDNPITRVEFLDLRESMRNGGGPACLRLRMVMNAAELAAMKQSVIFTDSLYKQLKDFISQNYREELSPADLADIRFISEARETTLAIFSLLKL